MDKRYAALRTIGSIYKVLGVIGGAVTILLVIAVCLTSVLGGAAADSFSRQFGSDIGLGGLFGGVLGGIVASLAIVLYGGGMALTLYAAGEGIYLLLALEENTRATALVLQRQAS
jgi:hypothetical protein